MQGQEYMSADRFDNGAGRLESACGVGCSGVVTGGHRAQAHVTLEPRGSSCRALVWGFTRYTITKATGSLEIADKRRQRLARRDLRLPLNFMIRYEFQMVGHIFYPCS